MAIFAAPKVLIGWQWRTYGRDCPSRAGGNIEEACHAVHQKPEAVDVEPITHVYTHICEGQVDIYPVEETGRLAWHGGAVWRSPVGQDSGAKAPMFSEIASSPVSSRFNKTCLMYSVQCTVTHTSSCCINTHSGSTSIVRVGETEPSRRSVIATDLLRGEFVDLIQKIRFLIP